MGGTSTTNLGDAGANMDMETGSNFFSGSSGGFDATSPSMSSSSGAATDFSGMQDVGIGQPNRLDDVIKVNKTLNDNGIETPHGPDIVDPGPIKQGQEMLNQQLPTGQTPLKTDGWVGQKTRQAFAEVNPKQSSTSANPAPLRHAEGDDVRRARMVKERSEAERQAKIDQHNQAMLLQRQAEERQQQQLAKMAQQNQKIAQQQKPRPQPVQPTKPQNAFKPLPQLSEDVKTTQENSAKFIKNKLRYGVGDYGKHSAARAVENFGDKGVAETIELADQLKRQGMPDRVEIYLKDTYNNIRNPALKERFKDVANRWHSGEDVFASRRDDSRVIGGAGNDTLGQTKEVNPKATYKNQSFRDEIAKRESIGNGGYNAVNKNEKGEVKAVGRYQFTDIALKQIKLKNEDGKWSGKYGINSLDDFLKKPEAQENAFTDYLKDTENQLRGKQAFDHLGQAIDGKKAKFKITKSGLLAAGHRQGAGAVRGYINHQKSNNWKSDFSSLEKGTRTLYESIETRLREFSTIHLD